MATHANTTPDPGTSSIAFLQVRRTEIQSAITALEPMLAAHCYSPSPIYAAYQTMFDGLMDELWALDMVILALPPASAEDLHIQTAIARQSIEEHLPNMPLLDKLLQNVERFAA